MSETRIFSYSIDVLRVLTWRHENSVNLRQIIQDKQDWLNENNRDFWQGWVTDVFDLRTANDFGLSVWAIILNLPIFSSSPAIGAAVWGFGVNNLNFGNGNFAGATASVVPLTTEELRLALRMRFFQLHSNGSVTQINQFLDSLFSDQGTAYMRDNLDMSVTFVFDFALPSNLSFVLENYDILPTPHGVSATIEVNP